MRRKISPPSFPAVSSIFTHAIVASNSMLKMNPVMPFLAIDEAKITSNMNM